MNSSHNFVANLSKATWSVSVSFRWSSMNRTKTSVTDGHESVGPRADRGLALTGGVLLHDWKNKRSGKEIKTSGKYKTSGNQS